MELGEKLKQARLAAGLSQRKLCGSVITRNMLSQIENGTARPSMDTLRYLAGVLEKPMGYFLEDEASEGEDPMCIARRAYRNGEYGEVLTVLSQFPRKEEGDERFLLELLSLLALAQQAICEKRLPYARQLLGSAALAEERTMYASEELRQRRLVLLSCAGAESASELAVQLPANDGVLLLRARGALEQGDLKACGDYLNACEDQEDGLWHLVSGEMSLRSEDFALAAVHYRAAEGEFPQECWDPLEQCYLAMEDYKQAYEYACKRRKEGASC